MAWDEWTNLARHVNARHHRSYHRSYYDDTWYTNQQVNDDTWYIKKKLCNADESHWKGQFQVSRTRKKTPHPTSSAKGFEKRPKAHWKRSQKVSSECGSSNKKSRKMLTNKNNFIEGSLEVKLPTIWTVEKQRWGDQKRKSKKTEDTDARKGRKVAKHCVFPMICGSGGSKK